MKEMIVAKGLFSKFTITLNDEVMDKLIYIKPKDNPLKAIEDDLNDLLKRFERTYFNAVNGPEADTQGTDLLSDSPKANSRTSEAQSGAGEKGRL